METIIKVLAVPFAILVMYSLAYYIVKCIIFVNKKLHEN